MNPLSALTGMSFGPQGSYQDLLTQEQMKAARQQGLLGFGSSMLANSGWSTQRPSLGASLGQSVMAGSQMQQQAQQQALQQQLLKRQMNAPRDGFTLNPGDVRFDAQGNPIAAVPSKPGDRWRPVTPEERSQYGIPGNAPAQINEQSGKVEWKQNGSLVTVNTGDEAAVPNNNIFANDARYIREELNKSQEDAVGLRTALEATWNARNMLDQGMITGFGADARLNLARAADYLGLGGADERAKITNTESFIAETGQLVGQVIKQFGAGTGLSDADREYARKISAGEIALNEQSLRKILEIREKAFTAAAKAYNQRLDAVGKHYTGVDDYYRRIDIAPPDDGWVTMPNGTRVRAKQ
jgi:hypothetical protein